jgi:hypothetical protein
MAQLQSYSVTRLSNAQLTVPRWNVEGILLDDAGVQVADFTGANSVVFPTVLGNLTAAKQDRWVGQVVTELILKRFGLQD